MAKPTTLQVLERLHKMIGDISTGNNYSQNIEQVNKQDVSVENLNGQFPAVNIVLGDIDYTTSQRNIAGEIRKEIPVFFDYYGTARDDEKEIEIWLETEQDFLIRFGDTTANGNTSYNMDGTAYDLEGLCLSINPVACRLFHSDGDDTFRVEFETTLKYEQQRNSATTFY